MALSVLFLFWVTGVISHCHGLPRSVRAPNLVPFKDKTIQVTFNVTNMVLYSGYSPGLALRISGYCSQLCHGLAILLRTSVCLSLNIFKIGLVILAYSTGRLCGSNNKCLYSNLRSVYERPTTTSAFAGDSRVLFADKEMLPHPLK